MVVTYIEGVNVYNNKIETRDLLFIIAVRRNMDITLLISAVEGEFAASPCSSDKQVCYNKVRNGDTDEVFARMLATLFDKTSQCMICGVKKTAIWRTASVSVNGCKFRVQCCNACGLALGKNFISRRNKPPMEKRRN